MGGFKRSALRQGGDAELMLRTSHIHIHMHAAYQRVSIRRSSSVSCPGCCCCCGGDCGALTADAHGPSSTTAAFGSTTGRTPCCCCCCCCCGGGGGGGGGWAASMTTGGVGSAVRGPRRQIRRRVTCGSLRGRKRKAKQEGEGRSTRRRSRRRRGREREGSRAMLCLVGFGCGGPAILASLVVLLVARRRPRATTLPRLADPRGLLAAAPRRPAAACVCVV